MASAVAMERWRRQFAALCGPVPRRAKALTGIEKEELEREEELKAARGMWDELSESFQSGMDKE